MSDLLKAFRKNAENMAVLAEAKRIRPVVPAFALCDTKDQQEMVVEKIKFHTAMQQGFDLCLRYLTGDANGGRNADD